MKNVIRFLAVMAIFCLVYLVSYRLSTQWMPSFDTAAPRLVRLPAKQNSIPRVTAQQNICIEVYDAGTGNVMNCHSYWNPAMAGLSEEELEQYLLDPKGIYEENDENNGYYRARLLQFDWMQVRIRKYYLHYRKE